MKVTKEHYEYIKQAFASLDVESINKHKANVLASGKYKDFNTRIVFDIARAAGLLKFVCEVLYKYVDDSHIETAYKAAAKELSLI